MSKSHSTSVAKRPSSSLTKKRSLKEYSGLINAEFEAMKENVGHYHKKLGVLLNQALQDHFTADGGRLDIERAQEWVNSNLQTWVWNKKEERYVSAPPSWRSARRWVCMTGAQFKQVGPQVFLEQPDRVGVERSTRYTTVSKMLHNTEPAKKRAVEAGHAKDIRAEWARNVKPLVDNLNLDALRKQRQEEEEKETKLQRKLGVELIKLGYKILSQKLHPDKGGSHQAMARLNKVKRFLITALSDL